MFKAKYAKYIMIMLVTIPLLLKLFNWNNTTVGRIVLSVAVLFQLIWFQSIRKFYWWTIPLDLFYILVSAIIILYAIKSEYYIAFRTILPCFLGTYFIHIIICGFKGIPLVKMYDPDYGKSKNRCIHTPLKAPI